MNESESPHLILLAPELSPAVVMDEDEEQEQAYDNLNDAQRIKPFAKADLHIVLNGDAYQIVVQHEGAVNPTKLISDGEKGNQD